MTNLINLSIDLINLLILIKILKTSINLGYYLLTMVKDLDKDKSKGQ
jgi:hypothetical protein